MGIDRSAGVGWYHAVAAALIPWSAVVRPQWAGVPLVLALIAHRAAMRSREGEPWRSTIILVSAAGALVFSGGWAFAGMWVLAAVGVAIAAVVLPNGVGGLRPDLLDVAAGTAVAVVAGINPESFGSGGGWAAAAILLLAARRTAGVVVRERRIASGRLRFGPPDREARGTVGLSGTVAASDGLPRTAPLELEVRSGSSLAILSDDGVESGDLFQTLTGRRPPLEGQFCIDGVPLESDAALVAAVAPGEVFLEGSLWDNVGALGDTPLDGDRKLAVRDACALGEIEDFLGDRVLGSDGSPLDPHHRLMVQLARVLVSSYRVIVVLDPMVWVNPVRGELWRAAVVRASVGRTAIWITPDRELASRAERTVVLRHGTLKDDARSSNAGVGGM